MQPASPRQRHTARLRPGHSRTLSHIRPPVIEPRLVGSVHADKANQPQNPCRLMEIGREGGAGLADVWAVAIVVVRSPPLGRLSDLTRGSANRPPPRSRGTKVSHDSRKRSAPPKRSERQQAIKAPRVDAQRESSVAHIPFAYSVLFYYPKKTTALWLLLRGIAAGDTLSD